jgi:trigger factor
VEPSKVTLEDVTAVRKRIEVEIAAADVQAELDRAFQLVGQQARLRGFRPGKAPRSVIERAFGDEVRRDVLSRLVEHSFHHAVEHHRLAIVGSPDIDAEVLKPGEALRYSATVDVRPPVVVGDLSGLEATRPTTAVGDADVEHVLGGLRNSVAQLRPVERNDVEAGDVVTVNLTSRLDGGEPQRREGLHVEAGEGTFPLALERQLVGQHRGARLSLRVPYPEDYANRNLAGKTAEFDVEVLDLRAKDLPPLDDDFARDHGRSETLAELRGKIRADLERQAEERAERAVREAIVEQLLARHQFEVPESMITRRADAILGSLDVRLPEGVDQERALTELRAQVRPTAERDVRADLLLDAIAEQEKISVTDADVSAEIAAVATREGQPAERVRAVYDRPEMRAALAARMSRERAMATVVARARIMPNDGSGEVARGK